MAAVEAAGVGEIRLVRTFRVGADGGLYPVNSAFAWRDGWNSAICGRGRAHRPPGERCRCGFYAYADPVYTAEQPPSRDVLAVVAVHGTMEIGTRGVRVGTARIEALWLSARVSDALADRVDERYPSVRLYRDRHVMLSAHPLTRRPEFRLPRLSDRERRRVRAIFGLAAAGAIVVGVLPASWTTGTFPGAVALLTLLATTIAIAVAGIARRSPPLLLAGLWLLAWMVSSRSVVSLLILLALAGWLAIAWRRAQRIGAPIAPPVGGDRRRGHRWPGQ